jgi:tRNA 2-selenouridine synthase SelU
MLKIIQEEIQKLQDELKAAEARKITIDHSVLARIRRDAAATRDKLMVEEELDFPEESIQEELPRTISASPAQTDAIPPDIPLSPAEYRLLQCLLYQQDYSWVQREGYMLSVLADGINEKLYDTFFDSVLDDTPELIEDYIDDLKEMIAP